MIPITASTVRLRLGYETGKFKGFGAFAEAEHLSTLGADDYNSTTNGQTGYSVVADPEFTTGLPMISITSLRAQLVRWIQDK